MSDNQQNLLGLFVRAIAVLARCEVEFIVVGGVAAYLEGADISTKDLDIVFKKSPENNTRLLAALRDLKAHYKDPAGRYIVPDAYKVEHMRLHLLRTELGDLDVLTRVGNDLTYSDLAGKTVKHELSGWVVHVLDLETVIETKEHANRPKDRATLPYLRRALLRRSDRS